MHDQMWIILPRPQSSKSDRLPPMDLYFEVSTTCSVMGVDIVKAAQPKNRSKTISRCSMTLTTRPTAELSSRTWPSRPTTAFNTCPNA